MRATGDCTRAYRGAGGTPATPAEGGLRRASISRVYDGDREQDHRKISRWVPQPRRPKQRRSRRGKDKHSPARQMAYSRERKLRAPPSGGGFEDTIGELDLDWDVPGTGSAGTEDGDIFACDEGSEEDRYFDSAVGALEEAVMDPAFSSLQQSFIDEWCGEFEDVEENKLIYTDLFRQYTQLVEQHIDGWLRQRIEGFEMEGFMKMLAERRDEVIGDVIDILTAVGDFTEFKSLMVAHRKGRDNGLVVKSVPMKPGAAADTEGHQQAKGRVGGPSTGYYGEGVIPARVAGRRREVLDAYTSAESKG